MTCWSWLARLLFCKCLSIVLLPTRPGVLRSWGHDDAVDPFCFFFRERAFCFVAFAALAGPLGWHIQLTVSGADECKANKVLLAWRRRCKGIALSMPGRDVDMKPH